MKCAYRTMAAVTLAVAAGSPGWAGPAFECSVASTSQIETGNCVAAADATVTTVIASALDIARGSAAELDDATGRTGAVPALEASQAAWEAYRDAQCAYVGASFGGGSGTGIALTACRVELGRARIRELLALAN